MAPVEGLEWIGQADEPPAGLEINRSLVDRWSLVHFASGTLLGLTRVPLGWTTAISGAYEAVEFMHEYPKGSAIFGSKRPESIGNVIADMVILLGGWYVGSRLTGK